MDHSRISDALITARLHSPETTSDWTRLPTLSGLLAGVIIALVAATVSGPIDPDSLAVMVFTCGALLWFMKGTGY